MSTNKAEIKSAVSREIDELLDGIDKCNIAFSYKFVLSVDNHTVERGEKFEGFYVKDLIDL